jgi:hypothetical protein
MLSQIRSAIARSQNTLVQDGLGLAALVVILCVGLHLPYLA